MARVVAVAAHPDDETAFAGGMLARYAAEGHEVYIVMVTRGEGGEVGDPPLSSIEDLGEVREREMRCAAEALGAREVLFLGFVDPRMEIDGEAQPIAASPEDIATAVRDVLDRLRPEIVMTHGTNGEYGHPHHVFTHIAVRAAVQQLQNWRPTALLTWCAFDANQPEDRFANKDDPADLVVDVTPWLDAKRAALACHRTQHAMIRRNSKLDDVLETVRRIEAFRRWPVESRRSDFRTETAK
ncbi:MAG TPA: PIG-L deacetylase family protein [Chloroflexota bacterium]|nr:PIG-L deacetylase family protein [Chloroflexota bacterium]